MQTILRRLDKLQKQNERRSGFVERESWNMFRVAPSCPPSKLVHARGGRLYATYIYGAAFDPWEYRAWTVPSLTADLGDMGSVTNDVVFTNANYYQFFLLELRLPLEAEEPTESDWAFYIHGTGDEFATSAEAEAWLNSEDFQLSEPWDHRSEDIFAYPLCGLVLKNDGNVGGGCQILPVDLVNRDRSYIWPRDFRPITSIYD